MHIQNNNVTPVTSQNNIYIYIYDEVNSVKNTTINIWLNDGVY